MPPLGKGLFLKEGGDSSSASFRPRSSLQEARLAENTCTLADLTEGQVGKLLIRKSGKVQLLLGKVTLDVTMGTTCSFLQVRVSLVGVEAVQDVDSLVLSTGEELLGSSHESQRTEQWAVWSCLSSPSPLIGRSWFLWALETAGQAT